MVAMQISAELVSIGSELLLGQIVDTNSAWIAQRLAEKGVNLYYKTTVGDNFDRMVSTISNAVARADVVITGGGIGPTRDDLTREAVAEVTGRRLVTDSEALHDLHERFQRRGFILTKNNEKQAQIPEGAVLVKNPNGTAPSFIVEDSKAVIFSLPGVPFEMKWLVENELIPYLSTKFGLNQVIHYRVLKVADLGESNVDDQIGHLIAESSNPTVGVLAHPGQVDVRIAARAQDRCEADTLIAPVEAKVRSILGDHVFAVDEETLEGVTGEILRARKLKIAVYEDLSGGAVAEAVSNAADTLFISGFVANSNYALNQFAVAGGESPPFTDGSSRAAALARAARVFNEADMGIAVHSVAQGDDRTENLGRGETYIAVAGRDSLRSRQVRSAGRGRPDRRRAAMHTLSLLRRELLDLEG